MRYLFPIIWIVVFQAVGAGIGRVTRAHIETWYAGLEKSALTPPDIVFPIVWSLLYVLIALAGWQAWKARHAEGGKILVALFGVYTVLNWGWSFIFFALHMTGAGFFWILALDAVAAAFIIRGWRICPVAAWLMIPPLVWTVFAAFLNYQIWVLNS